MIVQNTTVSLIICTYRRPTQVARLLKALHQQTESPQEIVVVDASPGPETEAMLHGIDIQRRGARLYYHRVSSEHRGLTRQRNYGVAHARGELIGFLDDDTVPEDDYFEELLACARRHPDAAGIGGYITDGLKWRSAEPQSRASLSVFRFREWECREDLRWRVRRVLNLASPLAPGWMPAFGHGRSLRFVPPDGRDHQVEFVMGGASLWRRDVLQAHEFSRLFEGYGLYEDLEFCLGVAHCGPLYLCTRARLAHHHAPAGRPTALRLGEMVVRNGWFVWRRRWPAPPWPDHLRWWATTVVLILCRYGNAVRGPARREALEEATGRVGGILTVLWDALLRCMTMVPLLSRRYGRGRSDDSARSSQTR